MKSDLLLLFGDQLRWFTSLNRKHRFFVVYFLLSFFLLCSVSEGNLIWVFFVVLNFGASTRLIKQVPINKLKD